MSHHSAVETASLKRGRRADDHPDLVQSRVAAETKQASILNSFEFKLNGQKITANDIDNKLEKSTDLTERKAVWEASKESVLRSNRIS